MLLFRCEDLVGALKRGTVSDYYCVCRKVLGECNIDWN